MEGIKKIAVLRVPAPGRSVGYSGTTFAMPPDKTPIEDLGKFWGQKLTDLGRTTPESQVAAIRAIIDLASTHVGVQVEQRDGSLVTERVRVEVSYQDEATGEPVTLKKDEGTGEVEVVRPEPKEQEEDPMDGHLEEGSSAPKKKGKGKK